MPAAEQVVSAATPRVSTVWRMFQDTMGTNVLDMDLQRTSNTE